MKSRMYEGVKTWNPFIGCRFNCVYCKPSFQRQAKRRKKWCELCYCYEPHFHPERLDRVPNARTIFACFVPNTIISGVFKEIGSIKTRDYVLGYSGRVRVQTTFKRAYSGKILNIKAAGTLPLKLTPEHPVLVVTAKPNRRNENIFSQPYWKEAREIKPKHSCREGDYLVIPKIKGYLNTRELRLDKFSNKQGIKISKSKGYPTKLYLDENLAWCLGLYVAEGYTSNTSVFFGLGKHEQKLLDKLENTLREMGYTPKTYCRETANCVVVPSKILKHAFETWCGNRAENKKIPEFILYHQDNKILNAFLEGYLVGDATFRESPNDSRGRGIHATTASLTLALQLQLLCIRLGKYLYIYKDSREGKEEIQGRIVNRRQHYQLRIPYSENRKPFKFFKDYVVVAVKSIKEETYKGFVYNLETSDKTYLAHNLVVHNCAYGDVAFAKLEDLKKVIDTIRKHEDRTFYIQTKDPDVFVTIANHIGIPKNLKLGVTLETCVDEFSTPSKYRKYSEISRAPTPRDRLRKIFFHVGSWRINYVTIEPIFDFPLREFVSWIKHIRPEFVYIGYDNHNCKLPEPPLEKTLQLIEEFKKFTEVKLKTIRPAWHEH